jgi:hypothetical protein
MNAKRGIWILILVLIISVLCHAEEPSPVYKNVISYDFGNFIASFSIYIVDPDLGWFVPFPSFGVGYERRINNLIGFHGRIEIDPFDAVLLTGFGVNLYPRRTALYGWYVGVSGNIYVHGLPTEYIRFGGGVISGYQWILPSQWVLRLGVGCRAIQFERGWDYYPNFEAAFGNAF